MRVARQTFICGSGTNNFEIYIYIYRYRYIDIDNYTVYILEDKKSTQT